MWEYFFKFSSAIHRQLGDLSRTQWVMVLSVVLVIGFICMRGFGSRTKY